MFQLVIKNLFGTLSNKRLAVLGFSFKENTNDTRESPAIDICKNLLNEGAYLSIHDEKVNESSIRKELEAVISKEREYSIDINKWEYQIDIYEAIKNSDAAIFITEWELYKNLDWARISRIVKKPFWIFDTRSILDYCSIKKVGLNIWQLGHGGDI